MLSRRSFLHLSGLLATGALLPARTASASATILTVTGAALPGSGPVAFDLAGLDALPQTRFRTETPWTEGHPEFSGVLLSDVLTAVRAAPRTLHLVALNDYVVEADAAELTAGSALLATRKNGTEMDISDKGPIFVIFPFDDRPELRHQTYYSRAVWQLAQVELLP